MAIMHRILADALTRLEFSRCHNEMEGHSSLQSCQQGDFEPVLKTRSAPALSVLLENTFQLITSNQYLTMCNGNGKCAIIKNSFVLLCKHLRSVNKDK